MIQKFQKICFQLQNQIKFQASKVQASSKQKTKDSAGRRLGVKKFGGQEVFPNDILIRQRGFDYHPGNNTYSGVDHTIHAKTEGIVRFERDPQRRKTFIIHVDKQDIENRKSRPPRPYCYHPELFPERAKFNPEPVVFNFERKEKQPEKPQTHCGKKVDQKVGQVQIDKSFLENYSKREFPSYSEQIQKVYQSFENNTE